MHLSFPTHPKKQPLRALIAVVLIIVITATVMPATALAHAELRQSSPDRGEIIGGDLHAITLQFFDLDVSSPQDAKIFDAAGNELPAQLNREGQRMVIALLDPIITPGEYSVVYEMTGFDGDFTIESFTFEWQEGAPEPKGITVDLTQPVGFDTFNYVLILIGAAIAAFLTHRFLTAFRAHKAAQAVNA